MMTQINDLGVSIAIENLIEIEDQLIEVKGLLEQFGDIYVGYLNRIQSDLNQLRNELESI